MLYPPSTVHASKYPAQNTRHTGRHDDGMSSGLRDGAHGAVRGKGKAGHGTSPVRHFPPISAKSTNYRSSPPETNRCGRLATSTPFRTTQDTQDEPCSSRSLRARTLGKHSEKSDKKTTTNNTCTLFINRRFPNAFPPNNRPVSLTPGHYDKICRSLSAPPNRSQQDEGRWATTVPHAPHQASLEQEARCQEAAKLTPCTLAPECNGA